MPTCLEVISGRCTNFCSIRRRTEWAIYLVTIAADEVSIPGYSPNTSREQYVWDWFGLPTQTYLRGGVDWCCSTQPTTFSELVIGISSLRREIFLSSSSTESFKFFLKVAMLLQMFADVAKLDPIVGCSSREDKRFAKLDSIVGCRRGRTNNGPCDGRTSDRHNSMYIIYV